MDGETLYPYVVHLLPWCNHLFHLFLCKSEMNAGQFSNHHGFLIIVSNHSMELFLGKSKGHFTDILGK